MEDKLKRLIKEIREIPYFINRYYCGEILSKDTLIKDPDDSILTTILGYYKRQYITDKEILGIIEKNQNELSSSVVKALLSEGIIKKEDLLKIGINALFVEKLSQNNLPYKPQRAYREITGIEKDSTEIYLWGIPATGKTCAIGALFSYFRYQEDLLIEYDTQCQGALYMEDMCNCFSKEKVSLLPESTPVTASYEMEFDVIDKKNNIRYPITMIDMAGEILRCMALYDGGQQLNKDELRSLNIVTNMLLGIEQPANDTMEKTVEDMIADLENGESGEGNKPKKVNNNHKIHLFIIEYDAENRLYDGYPQSFYIYGAMNYIKTHRVFDKTTDAIFVLVTKADKTNESSFVKRETIINDYLKECYNNFIEILELVCKERCINDSEETRKNDRRVIYKSFSLGEICFQNYCLYNPFYSGDVLKELLAQSYSTALSSSDGLRLVDIIKKIFKG